MQRVLQLLIMALALGFLAPAGGVSVAQAEVRFGKNVRIGGHDFSNRRYKGVHIERTNKRPPWYGCRVFRPGQVYQGRKIRHRVEICNLKNIPPHKRKRVR